MPPLSLQHAARYLAARRPDEAIAVLERLVEEVPAYASAHVLLGRAYEAAGRPHEALRAWHEAFFLMPTSPLVARERQRLLMAHPAAAEPEEPAIPSTEPADWQGDELDQDERLDQEDQAEQPQTDESAWAAEMAEPTVEAEAEAAEVEQPQGEEASAFQAEPLEEAERDWVPLEPEPFDLSDEPEDAGPEAEDEEPFFGADEAEVISPDEELGDALGPEEAFEEDEEDWKILEEVDEGPERDAVAEARLADPFADEADEADLTYDEPDIVDVEVEDLPAEEERTPDYEGPDPEAQVREMVSRADDLDTLIEQLENAPRIRPDPEFKGSDELEGDEEEGLVSETLARIYAGQKEYAQAAEVYDKLAAQQPGRAAEFQEKAADLRARATGSQG